MKNRKTCIARQSKVKKTSSPILFFQIQVVAPSLPMGKLANWSRRPHPPTQVLGETPLGKVEGSQTPPQEQEDPWAPLRGPLPTWGLKVTWMFHPLWWETSAPTSHPVWQATSWTRPCAAQGQNGTTSLIALMDHLVDPERRVQGGERMNPREGGGDKKREPPQKQGHHL